MKGREMKYTDIKGMKISKITLSTVQLGVNYGIKIQAESLI